MLSDIRGVIDCDLHPTIPKIGQIFPYISQEWRRVMEYRKDALFFTQIPGRQPRWSATFNQIDAAPPGGGAPGSDPQWMARHYLDQHDIETGILLGIDGSRVDAWSVVDEAAVVASGFNNLMAEEWLPQDRRFRMCMLVSPHDPQLAADEIRRFGSTQGVVGVWIPLLNQLLGTRYYWPIYDAAQELGLPIIAHPTGSTGDVIGPPVYAGGNPGSRFEHYTLLPEFGISNVCSLVYEGIFERFPGLNFLFYEFGWTWLPGFMWRWDSVWQAGRPGFPWLKKAPSEYIREHIRFSTQPCLEIPSEVELEGVLNLFDSENSLIFTSDYPHWDAERPETVFRNQSAAFRQKIFRDNAIKFFGERILTPDYAKQEVG